ncbi:amidohydrolase family protein [Georgenia satyanarayanai]|uniref:N-acyl-D-amino-acid deacylase family protein n=1 Tax=Georgenia satyanarayanai TaxID=860221 RepID=UPI0020404D19|nr:amidohydrolase family protein [Georgenia satyanarayanai]MCM3660265.1 amidohydrolase family protein [Georgenia satyanarayanai]
MRLEVRGARLAGRGERLHDVLIHEGRIAAIGPAAAASTYAERLEAHGRLLLPGFVDAHSHADAAVFAGATQHALLRQGVTTVVVGQDGVSWAPADEATQAWATHYFAAVNGVHPTFSGGSVAELLATYDATVPVNVAYLAPYGTLRHGVAGGADRPLDGAERALLRDRLEQALDDGACGLSTGLEYAPARYADAAELCAVLAPLAERGLAHVTHMRGYQERALEALAEVVAVGATTGAATHVSHLHGPAAPLAAAIDAARADGRDVSFDSYPYLRGATILSMLALPGWVPVAEPARAVQMLRRPHTRAAVRAHLDGLDHLWERVVLSAVPGELAWTEALALTEAADRLGCTPADAVIEILLASGLRAGGVFAQGPEHTTTEVSTLMQHDAHMTGSDAIYAGSHPHPRGWGAFARCLAQQVRDRDEWDWQDAVEHHSARAVRRFGLGDRGRVGVGAVADLVLLDPAQVQDHATYDEPRRLATGVDDVLVAGVPVLRAGELTGRLPGRGLRAGAGAAA